MSYSLPAGALCRNAQRLKIKAWFKSLANGNTKAFALYFGNVSIATGALTANPTTGFLELEVCRTGEATQNICKRGQADATSLANAYAAGAVDLTAAVTIKLTGTGATSGIDCIAEQLTVEMCQEA